MICISFKQLWQNAIEFRIFKMSKIFCRMKKKMNGKCCGMMGNFSPFACIPTDSKYLVLPSGELHIKDVGPEDGYKSYQCRTKHRLTGETRLSATKGRLVITGE